MDGPGEKIPLVESDEESISLADLRHAIDLCGSETTERHRKSSVDSKRTHNMSMASSTIIDDDLVPVHITPRDSFSSRSRIDFTSKELDVPKNISVQKCGDKPAVGTIERSSSLASWDDLNNEIERAMRESIISVGHLDDLTQSIIDDAETTQEEGPWSCVACTFLNDNPLHLVCGVCGTAKAANRPPLPTALNASFVSVGSQKSQRKRRVTAPAQFKSSGNSSFNSQSSRDIKKIPPTNIGAVRRQATAPARMNAPESSAVTSQSTNTFKVSYIASAKFEDDSLEDRDSRLEGSDRSSCNDNVYDDLLKSFEEELVSIQSELETSMENVGSLTGSDDLKSSLQSFQCKIDSLKSSYLKVEASMRNGGSTADFRDIKNLFCSLHDKVVSLQSSFAKENERDLKSRTGSDQQEKSDYVIASFLSDQSSAKMHEVEFDDSSRSPSNVLKYSQQCSAAAKECLRRSSTGSISDDVRIASGLSKRSGRLVRSIKSRPSIDDKISSRLSLRSSHSSRRSSVDFDVPDDDSFTSGIFDQSYYSLSDDDDKTMKTMQTIKLLRVPEKMVTIIYTDVQGSTSLWESYPLPMKKATDVHDSIMRKCYADHGGYEISTEGDSFNLAFQHPADAISFALKAQLALYKANWPEEILSHEDGKVNEKRAFRGFRVRMGMHHGPVKSSVHETTGRTIYQGEAVDIAKSIEKMSHGGQILTTVETWRAVSGMAEQMLGKPQVMDCGEHLLYDPKRQSKAKGSSKSKYQSKRILQLVPSQLAYDFFAARGGQELKEGETPQRVCGRVFPPLLSHGQLSTSFLNAPFVGNRVAMVFVYTDKMENAFENERKRNHKYLARYIRKHLMQLSPPGYECQEDKGNWMLAFDSTKSGIKFALELNETVLKSEKLRGNIDKKKIFKIGIHWGPFLSMGPHTITGHADYFGPIVNRAARVAAQSEPGQVCVGIPMDTDEEPPDPGPSVEIEVLGIKQLKGITTEMAIFSCRKNEDSTLSEEKQSVGKSAKEKGNSAKKRSERKSSLKSKD